MNLYFSRLGRRRPIKDLRGRALSGLSVTTLAQGDTMRRDSRAKGVSDSEVGEALAPFRLTVAIATKFGFKIHPSTGKQAGLDSRPWHIKEVPEASLPTARHGGRTGPWQAP